MSRIWDWSQWGTWKDPIHKSDLNGIVGKFGCTEQFRRKKEERATGRRVYEKASGKLICGNAAHNVIARILRSAPACEAALHPEYRFPLSSIESTFEEEYENERAGREVDWYKVKPDKWKRECVQMVHGMINDIHNHVKKVVLVEAGFIYHLDGIWLTGMTDLVYLTHNDGLGFVDWKTGAQKPHQIDLDHGWESGIYSGALERGLFVPGENIMHEDGREHRDSVEAVCIELAGLMKAAEATNGQTVLPGVEDPSARLAELMETYGAVRFNTFPDAIRHCHLRDFIPYSRKTHKTLSRPEELAWAGLAQPEKVTFEKGDTRGPGWLHVVRSQDSITRLTRRLRSVVQWVREGLFVDAAGEMCSRCRFREPCLNDGYQPVGEEAERLNKALKVLDDDAFDGFDVDDL